MDISNRKVEYNGKQVFVFDLIIKDPEWVYRNILDTLTPAEISFFNAYRKPEPAAQIEINADDFINILSPYLSEVVFSELHIDTLCDSIVSDVNEYNRRSKSWYKSYGYARPYWNLDRAANNPLVPCLHTVESLVHKLEAKFQYIRQKYKKSKIDEETYQSILRFRDNLNKINDSIREKLIEYGVTLRPYFMEWENWKNNWDNLQKSLEKFRETCHYKGYMEFGKYYNKSINYVIRKDINYIKWALKNKPDFILRGDDLEEFIKKAGYDPYVNSANIIYPSNEAIVNIASLLGASDCELDSIVFKVSNLPATKVLVSLTEKYPCLKYNMYSKENQYYISFSGTFEDSTMNKEVEKISEESESSSEIKVKELLY